MARRSFSQVDLGELAKIHDKNGVPSQNFAIEIDESGRWHHEGREIKRPALVKLFASVLTRLEDGSYWLITPAERGRIKVADAPFYITSMRIEKGARGRRIFLKTSLDDEVLLGRDHRIRLSGSEKNTSPRPYVNIRGNLEALIARSVYYELAALAEEQDGHFILKSDGIVFRLD